MKHKNKNQPHNGANIRKMGIIFLCIGLLLVIFAFTLRFIFIDEEFKTEYRQSQYDECIEKGNDQQVCEEDFK